MKVSTLFWQAMTVAFISAMVATPLTAQWFCFYGPDWVRMGREPVGLVFTAILLWAGFLVGAGFCVCQASESMKDDKKS